METVVVSNPFIAGHFFLLSFAVGLTTTTLLVSNPFIAGHSFLRSGKELGMFIPPGFKPLHSGAFLLTPVTGGDRLVPIRLFQTPS